MAGPDVNATDILLEIGGGVALLLWGVRMVRTGMTRAFGAHLRQAIGVCAARRLPAAAAGVGATLVLQSSTATTLIVSSFAGRGLLTTAAGLAVVLGADVGTSLVAVLMSFRLPWLPPLLLMLGVGLFMTASGDRARHLGRVGIGLGLMLLALHLLVTATLPLRDTAGLPLVLASLAAAPVVAVLVAMLLTWLSHSSLAIVLLLTSLAANSLLAPPLALALVLGANLGSGLVSVLITAAAPGAARRVPLGNLLMQATLVALLLPLVPEAAAWLAALFPDPGGSVVAAHVAFNLLLAMVMLPAVGPVAKLLQSWLPDQPVATDDRKPRYLEPGALETPAEALACATREALRIGDHVEDMLKRTIDVLANDDARLARQVEARDDVVDSLYEAVKLYVTAVTRQELDEAESRRAVEILTFTTNLEHVGDIIDRNLMELAAKKIKHQLRFSPAGFEEIRSLHAMVLGTLRLALNAFITGDLELARQLLAQKVSLRSVEQAAAEQHLARLTSGRPDTVESSSLHLDIVRDLKRINSHLTSIAYAILEQTGELADSRLQSARARIVHERPA